MTFNCVCLVNPNGNREEDNYHSLEVRKHQREGVKHDASLTNEETGEVGSEVT